jgi:hypothetical protein
MTIPSPEPVEARGFTLGYLFSALPSFGLSVVFLITWVDPYVLGERMISYLMLVMLMEFINVHAAGFMGTIIISDFKASKKTLVLIGLGLFYSLFLLGFSLGFGEWWPIWAFWGLVLNRLLGIFFGKALSGQEKAMIMSSWGIGVFCYVMLVFATVMLPVPALGVTQEAIDLQGFSMEGLWIEEPFRVLAFGFLYFAAIGLWELFSFKWAVQHGNVGRLFQKGQ